MRPVRLSTASFLLLFSPADVPRGRRALQTVLDAADTGDPAGLRILARAVARLGHEAVWQVWLEPRVSGRPARRWDSPAPAELAADASTVPDRVVDVAWNDWQEHDSELWSLLKRWNRPTTVDAAFPAHGLSRLALGDTTVSLDPAVLAATAARFDHPLGEQARDRLLALGVGEAVDLYCAASVDSPDMREFCVTHGLAPSDEVMRAVFFVRTAQQDQYEALDPDGALLALGYRSVPKKDRAALRAAMADLNGIDTLRVLAGQGSDEHHFVSLTEKERTYLVGQLTDRGDWARLWRLVPLMPLAEAVGTVRRFGAWRPAAADARELFEKLRAADPLVVDDGLSAVAVMPSRIEPVSLTLPDGFGAFAVHDLDFSPDGQQLAYAGSRQSDRGFAGVMDLRRRSSLFHRSLEFRLSHVAHLGQETIVGAGAHTHSVSNAFAKKIFLIDHLGARPLPFEIGQVSALERLAGKRAFLLVAQQGKAASDPRLEVFLGAADDSPAQLLTLRGRNLFPPRTAVSPDGRLAVLTGKRDVLATDLGDGTVHRIHRDPVDEGLNQSHTALSSSTLVRIARSGALQVWHAPYTSTRKPLTTPVWPEGDLPTAIAWSPALHRFVTLRDTYLEILDVPPTRRLPLSGEVIHQLIELVHARRERPLVRLSPQGDVLAVAGDSPVVHLYDLSPQNSALTRPMGSMNAEDLAEVRRLRRQQDLGPTARRALALLSACLKHRFRHDIGIGDAARTALVADHEIALGRDGTE
ncbi:WD40 repeat domain-containing protein [Streptomyces sp. NBC_00445]|uniref:WD40 repeat domain-containing protein n=1 Tax=Streptomyces sp. NBC_00445 TaxID=2975745 RepID=UPI002E1EE4BD